MNIRRKSALLALVGGVAAVAISVPVVSALAEDSRPDPEEGCELTELAIPAGYAGAWAHDVSDSGEYVAGGVPGKGGSVPALWHDGEVTVPPKLTSDASSAAGVNDSGLMVGSRVVGGVTVPWVAKDGNVADLAVPNGHSGFARDIDNAGAVVGHVVDEDGEQTAALWTSPDAEPVLLDKPRDTDSSVAYSIGEDGTIVGKLLDPRAGTVDLWMWNADGTGEKLSRPAPGGLVDGGVKVRVTGDRVVSVNTGNQEGDYPAYVWDLSEGTEGTEVELPFAQAVSADGTIVGSTRDHRPAMLVDGELVELPGSRGPGGNPDSNSAHDITPDGGVVIGTVEDGDTSQPVRWTCG